MANDHCPGNRHHLYSTIKACRILRNAATGLGTATALHCELPAGRAFSTFSLGAFSLSVRITDSAINPELRIHAHTLLMDQQSGLDYDHKKNQSI